MNIRKFFYNLKKYWRELLTFVFAIITAIIALLFSSSPGLIFSFTVLLTILLLSLTLYIHFKEKEYYYLALDNVFDKENWFGSGKFELDKPNNAYVISDTDAGFIFTKCLLWKDYSIAGEFKILNQCLGVIFRATDLSNYVMLQITKDGIRPHIRSFGGWLVYETKDTSLTFEQMISDGRWYKFDFIVKGENVEIRIVINDSVIIDKSWNIPKVRMSVPVYEIKDEKRESMTHVLDNIVSYDYGSVGFRNYHGETALIKKILIKSLNS